MTANTILITYQIIWDLYTGLWDMSFKMWQLWYYQILLTLLMVVWHMCFPLTPRKPLQPLGLLWHVLWLMPLMLVNFPREIMTCEPIDIIYFTLGTGNYEFKCYESHMEFWGRPFVLYCTICNTIYCLILLLLAVKVDLMHQLWWLLMIQNETNTISEVVDDLKWSKHYFTILYLLKAKLRNLRSLHQAKLNSKLPIVMYNSAVWFLRLSRGIGLHILSLKYVHCDTQHPSLGSLVFAHLGSI